MMFRALLVMTLALASVACMPLGPYRTVEQGSAANCSPDSQWKVAGQCERAAKEVNSSYDLLFVEFTDQGLQFPSEQFGDTAAYQINNALGHLGNLASSSPGGLYVVVYVHGWKHNASSNDEDVRNFRRLLQDA